jgi:bifunctional non-homologous end joining protein LigD
MKPAASIIGGIRPMLATDEKRQPFTSPDWVFEIKFDGYRMLAGVDHGQVELRYKGGGIVTAAFPEICQALARLPGGPHVLDGEACVLDEMGRSDFEAFRARASRRRPLPGVRVTYCAFDLLVHDGRSVMDRPLQERKALLASLVSGLASPHFLHVTSIQDEGEALFRHVLGLELEGLVAKRKDSPYLPGQRSAAWQKLKRKGAVPAGRFKDTSAKRSDPRPRPRPSREGRDES